MKPIIQTPDPLLQREITSHHPATSVAALLAILTEAEQGDITRQAELFTDMEERDAHIYAELHKRKIAVSQLDWTLAPARDAGEAEKKLAAELAAIIQDSLDIDTLIFDLASAIGHGFAATEIEWGKTEKGYWLPVKLYPRPQRWFTVDRETYQQIRLRQTGAPYGVELVKYGWILHQHSAKTGYPATQGLFRALALPYLFKNFAVKNWLRFCELYAVPIRVLMTQQKDPEQKRELLKQLQAMGQNGVALLDGMLSEDLHTVDAARGEGQGFLALIEWAERSMSKAILGGTLTSDSGKNGNYATASVHDDVRYQIRDHDAKQIADTLTRDLIGAILAINGLNLRCRWQFDTQEAEDLALYADALPKLVSVGAQIPVAWAQDKLKIPLPEGNEPVLASAKPEPTQPNPNKTGLSAGLVTLAGDKPRFTPEQQAIEDLADQTLNALDSPISAELIAGAIRAAKSPEDLEARLAAVLQGADLTEFSRVLEKALFAADVMGYAHAS